MSEKPRVLVIDRDSDPAPPARLPLDDSCEVVRARTMARALHLLRDQRFDAVFVSAAQLSSLHWAGMLIQSDEILEAIADGVAVVEPGTQRILWYNPEFRNLASIDSDPIDRPFFEVLDHPERCEPDLCAFSQAERTKHPAGCILKLGTGNFFRLNVTPILDASGGLQSLIALTRDITDEVLQEQKVRAINKAGEELADLTPEELGDLRVSERIDLLKYNIVRHMRDLLGLDFIEIRLLRPSGRLDPLLTEGMTPLAADRQLYASEADNGVTGFVAATGKGYLCSDTTRDPRYLEGAADSRSSLTVPLVRHGTVIGTLNVESPKPNAFDLRDQQYLEIYARNIASALTTLELLEAEKVSTATASVEAIARELALPLDDILGDATTALDRYAGHDEDIVNRLRHLLERAREIRGLVRRAGATVLPENSRNSRPPKRLADARVLVVDADEAIRGAAHQLLEQQGATVETARDAQEAIALARQTPYDAALLDIRLPDLDGYEAFRRILEVQPGVPVILMTGFGYDPTHSIVKARKEGLRTVLYKPFHVERLIDAVEQAIRAPAATPGPDGFPPAPPLDRPEP
ncbi:response regulator [Tautonia plasticadhaerens]|uniref:C4-dicarboxylate transport transcriptional regulatory protein DctD n=1 Tax=Tautonia plasticadhaerens TaxID=2527974 RepID=A0A518GZ05_9BACT|nr:response regulator [Tautonia plasticadhaerens]QDV33850.1 C4-dicarboxylate transport transcriptional regulatory protein DctD [Tautonia plasticadhaerens]